MNFPAKFSISKFRFLLWIFAPFFETYFNLNFRAKNDHFHLASHVCGLFLSCLIMLCSVTFGGWWRQNWLKMRKLRHQSHESSRTCDAQKRHRAPKRLQNRSKNFFCSLIFLHNFDLCLNFRAKFLFIEVWIFAPKSTIKCYEISTLRNRWSLEFSRQI